MLLLMEEQDMDKLFIIKDTQNTLWRDVQFQNGQIGETVKCALAALLLEIAL
jgi:hypothetical protein